MALNAAAWATSIQFSMDSEGMLNGLDGDEKDAIYDAWKVVCQAHINSIFFISI